MLVDYFLFIVAMLIAITIIVYLWMKNTELENKINRSGDYPPKVPIDWNDVMKTILEYNDSDNASIYKDVLILDEDFNTYWRATGIRIIEDRPVLIMERL